MPKQKTGKGKRLTIRAKLLPYIESVMEAFGLEDESAAVNLIIGSCSVKPISWLAMRPGDNPPPLPPAAIEVSVQQVKSFKSESELERNALDMLCEDIDSLRVAA
ncbi:MAG TPA: hypothetical protein V6D14_31660 [Coleofasciculaceae cyanobacterium]|jgi:hypothetical protein